MGVERRTRPLELEKLKGKLTMAVTDHYSLWYVEDDEEMSEFPGTWSNTVDKLDTAIYTAQEELDNARAGNYGGTLARRTSTGGIRFEFVAVDSTVPAESDYLTSKEYVDGENAALGDRIDGDTAALGDRIDESRRLIGINDEYVGDALNRVDTLETEVPALDDRVTTLEQSSGGGGGDGSAVYDSGVREVNSLFPGLTFGHPSALCTLSRFGPMVTLTLSTVGFDGTGNVELGDIPDGFRPPSTLRFDALSQGDPNIQCAVRSGNNDVWAYSVPGDTFSYTAHIVYRTGDSAPADSDLPGNAA